MIDFCWVNIWGNETLTPLKVNFVVVTWDLNTLDKIYRLNPNFLMWDWGNLTKISKWAIYYTHLFMIELFLSEGCNLYLDQIHFEIIEPAPEILCNEESKSCEQQKTSLEKVEAFLKFKKKKHFVST